MKFVKNDITLSRLRHEDLDFLRSTFNTKEVFSLMNCNEEISVDKQQEWFESVNTHSSIYFILEYQNIKIGVLHCKNSLPGSAASESDLYLWDETKTDIPLVWMEISCLIELEFYYLNIGQVHVNLFTSTKNDADKLLSEGFSSTSDIVFSITQQVYKSRNIDTTLLSSENLPEVNDAYLLLEPHDYESGFAQQIENYFIEGGIYLHRRGITGSRKYFMPK